MRSISNPFLAAFDRELELALREVTGGSSALGGSDVTALAVTLLQEAAEVVDVQGIDAAIKATVSVDVAALQKAVALFEPYAGLQSKVPTSGGKLVTMSDQLARMKGRVTVLQTVNEPLGIGLAMSFLGMAMTIALAILYEHAKPVPPELQELLSKKLAAIPEANLWNAWRQVQQEFAVDEDYPSYDPAGPEVPAEFFSVSDAETARARVGTFLIDVKPKLFISRSQKGTKESPAIPHRPETSSVGEALRRLMGGWSFCAPQRISVKERFRADDL